MAATKENYPLRSKHGKFKPSPSTLTTSSTAVFPRAPAPKDSTTPVLGASYASALASSTDGSNAQYKTDPCQPRRNGHRTASSSFPPTNVITTPFLVGSNSGAVHRLASPTYAAATFMTSGKNSLPPPPHLLPPSSSASFPAPPSAPRRNGVASHDVSSSTSLTMDSSIVSSGDVRREMAPTSGTAPPLGGIASGMTLVPATQPFTFYTSNGPVGVAPSLYTAPQPSTFSYAFSPAPTYPGGLPPFPNVGLPPAKNCAHVNMVSSGPTQEYIPVDTSHQTNVVGAVSGNVVSRYCLSMNHGVLPPGANPPQVILAAAPMTVPAGTNGQVTAPAAHVCQRCSFLQGHHQHHGGDVDANGEKNMHLNERSLASTSNQVGTVPMPNAITKSQIETFPSVTLSSMNYLIPPQACRAVVHSSSPPSCSNSPSPEESPNPTKPPPVTAFAPVPFTATSTLTNSSTSTQTSATIVSNSSPYFVGPVQHATTATAESTVVQLADSASTTSSGVTTLTASLTNPMVSTSKQLHLNLQPQQFHVAESTGNSAVSVKTDALAQLTKTSSDSASTAMVSTTVVRSQQVIFAPQSIAYPQHLPQQLFIQHLPSVNPQLAPPIPLSPAIQQNHSAAPACSCQYQHLPCVATQPGGVCNVLSMPTGFSTSTLLPCQAQNVTAQIVPNNAIRKETGTTTGSVESSLSATSTTPQYSSNISGVSPDTVPCSPSGVSLPTTSEANQTPTAVCVYRPEQYHFAQQPPSLQQMPQQHLLHTHNSAYHEIVYPKLASQIPCQNVLGIQAFLKRKRSPVEVCYDPMRSLDHSPPPESGVGRENTDDLTLNKLVPDISQIGSGGVETQTVPLLCSNSTIESPSSSCKSTNPSSTDQSEKVSELTPSPEATQTVAAENANLKPQFAFPLMTVDRSSSVPKDAAAFNFHPAPVAFVAVAPQNGGTAVGFPPVGGEDYIYAAPSVVAPGVIAPNVMAQSVVAPHVLMAGPEDGVVDEAEDSTVKGSTPWCKAGKLYSMDVIGLHQEVLDFFDYMSPKDEEHLMREHVVNKISSVIMQLLPEAQVEVFGSFKTGLYLPTSDIDLVVIGRWDIPPLWDLESALVKANVAEASTVKVLDKATVPIVKLVDIETDVKVDISFNMLNGLRSVKLIRSYIETFPNLPYLVLVLKQFLLQRDLNEVFIGGISSYSLILMTISFLQLHGNRDLKTSDANLGVLLLEFFEHYGLNFDYYKTAIRIKDGGSYMSKDEFVKRMGNGNVPGHLCIEDPLTPGNDIGKGSYHADRVAQAYAKAFYALQQAVNYTKGQLNRSRQACDSILMNIIQIPNEVVQYRSWVQESFRMHLSTNSSILMSLDLLRPASRLSYSADGTVALSIGDVATMVAPQTLPEAVAPPTPSPSPTNDEVFYFTAAEAPKSAAKGTFMENCSFSQKKPKKSMEGSSSSPRDKTTSPKPAQHISEKAAKPCGESAENVPSLNKSNNCSKNNRTKESQTLSTETKDWILQATAEPEQVVERTFSDGARDLTADFTATTVEYGSDAFSADVDNVRPADDAADADSEDALGEVHTSPPGLDRGLMDRIRNLVAGKARVALPMSVDASPTSPPPVTGKGSKSFPVRPSTLPTEAFLNSLISKPPPTYHRHRPLPALNSPSKEGTNALSSTSSDGGATDATDGADATSSLSMESSSVGIPSTAPSSGNSSPSSGTSSICSPPSSNASEAATDDDCSDSSVEQYKQPPTLMNGQTQKAVNQSKNHYPSHSVKNPRSSMRRQETSKHPTDQTLPASTADVKTKDTLTTKRDIAVSLTQGNHVEASAVHPSIQQQGPLRIQNHSSSRICRSRSSSTSRSRSRSRDHLKRGNSVGSAASSSGVGARRSRTSTLPTQQPTHASEKASTQTLTDLPGVGQSSGTNAQGKTSTLPNPTQPTLPSSTNCKPGLQKRRENGSTDSCGANNFPAFNQNARKRNKIPAKGFGRGRCLINPEGNAKDAVPISSVARPAYTPSPAISDATSSTSSATSGEAEKITCHPPPISHPPRNVTLNGVPPPGSWPVPANNSAPAPAAAAVVAAAVATAAAAAFNPANKYAPHGSHFKTASSSNSDTWPRGQYPPNSYNHHQNAAIVNPIHNFNGFSSNKSNGRHFAPNSNNNNHIKSNYNHSVYHHHNDYNHNVHRNNYNYQNHTQNGFHQSTSHNQPHHQSHHSHHVYNDHQQQQHHTARESNTATTSHPTSAANSSASNQLRLNAAIASASQIHPLASVASKTESSTLSNHSSNPSLPSPLPTTAGSSSTRTTASSKPQHLASAHSNGVKTNWNSYSKGRHHDATSDFHYGINGSMPASRGTGASCRSLGNGNGNSAAHVVKYAERTVGEASKKSPPTKSDQTNSGAVLSSSSSSSSSQNGSSSSTSGVATMESSGVEGEADHSSSSTNLPQANRVYSKRRKNKKAARTPLGTGPSTISTGSSQYPVTNKAS